jgi:hypothetical protein
MPDTWTAIQFDGAVTKFGLWIENKLHELDETTHKPKYELQDLLSPPDTEAVKSATIETKVDKATSVRGFAGSGLKRVKK